MIGIHVDKVLYMPVVAMGIACNMMLCALVTVWRKQEKRASVRIRL